MRFSIYSDRLNFEEAKKIFRTWIFQNILDFSWTLQLWKGVNLRGADENHDWMVEDSSALLQLAASKRKISPVYYPTHQNLRKLFFSSEKMKIVQRKSYKEFKWKITEEKLWSIFVSNLHFVTNNLPWALINILINILIDILINILIDILINILINILVNISTEKRELIYFVGTHFLWRKAIGISLFGGWKPSLLFFLFKRWCWWNPSGGVQADKDWF